MEGGSDLIATGTRLARLLAMLALVRGLLLTRDKSLLLLLAPGRPLLLAHDRLMLIILKH